MLADSWYIASLWSSGTPRRAFHGNGARFFLKGGPVFFEGGDGMETLVSTSMVAVAAEFVPQGQILFWISFLPWPAAVFLKAATAGLHW